MAETFANAVPMISVLWTSPTPKRKGQNTFSALLLASISIVFIQAIAISRRLSIFFSHFSRPCVFRIPLLPLMRRTDGMRKAFYFISSVVHNVDAWIVGFWRGLSALDKILQRHNIVDFINFLFFGKWMCAQWSVRGTFTDSWVTIARQTVGRLLEQCEMKNHYLN